MDEKSLFEKSPLHNDRHLLSQYIKSLNIQTGDLFFRTGNESFLGIPFSRLVAKATNSKYSHSSLAIIRNKEIYLLEVNDSGTEELPLIDWLDYCYNPVIGIFRYKNLTRYRIEQIRHYANQFLKIDPDYDFTFDQKDKFYCTESVVQIYKSSGIKLCDPCYPKDILTSWAYCLVSSINYIVKSFTDAGIPMKNALYIVGNETQGILSNENLERICEIDESFFIDRQ